MSKRPQNSEAHERPFWILPAGILAVSADALGVAFIAQHVFGLAPCALCIWQRWPYVFAAVCALLALSTPVGRYGRTGLMSLAAAAFVAGAGISGFHAGVEYGWWAGLPECGGAGVSPEVSMRDLDAVLSGQERPVSCSEPALVVLGLSMAGWNFLVSLALAATTILALAGVRRR